MRFLRDTRSEWMRLDRGSNELHFTAKPSSKGVNKCNKDLQSVTMTMFYDEDDHVFLEKQMQIEGYLLDEFDETKRQLGKADLDIAMYMKSVSGEKFMLQVTLQDDQGRKCTVKFQVNIVKIDDDTKSGDTSEGTSTQPLTLKIKEPKGKVQMLGVEQFSSRGVSPVSIREKSNPKKVESRRNSSRKQIVVPKPQIREQPANKQVSEWSESSIAKATQEEMLSKHRQKTQMSSLNDSWAAFKPQMPPLFPKKENPNESPELQLFLCEKKLRQKEEELKRARRQMEGQQKLIDQLLKANQELKLQPKQIQSKKELEQTKDSLLQARIKIGQLQTANRHHKEREEELEYTAEKQGKQLRRYKDLLQQQKMKMARVMQKCLEEGDLYLVELIEQEITD